MNNHDYFMRQIEDMAQFLAKTFFHKITEEVPLFDAQGTPLESGMLYGTICAMASEGKINEAENLLFEKLESVSDRADEYLNIAIKFYSRLNKLTEEQLSQYNFTRAEILEGLSEVKKICEEISAMQRNG